jgi:integrase
VCHTVVCLGMLRRVKLYARINDAGRYIRVPVVFGKSGRATTPTGIVTGYLIRKAGRFLSVGDDLDVAVTRLHQEQMAVSGGVETVKDAQLVTAPELQNGRQDIKAAIAAYQRDLETVGKAKSTIGLYTGALDKFAKSTRKTFIDELNRADILAFVTWLRANLLVRTPGAQATTIRNHLTYLGIFLQKYGVKLMKTKNGDADGLMFRDDRPKPVKKKPKKHDQDTIEKLMGAADVDEKDYLQFLLWSGFRDEEVQYLEWKDFDWKNSTVTCHEKPHFDWKPKDHEERTVQLPSEVTARMKERMKRGEGELVFPNTVGRPDSHLLHRLHAVANKAGLDLRGQRAGHAFRKTAGSRVARKLGLRAAMDFLGHSDVQTTARYLAADDMASKRSREVFDQMFADGD